MRDKQLIIFDWDGTVMDTVPKIVNTVKLVAKKHHLEAPSDHAIRGIIGLSLETAIAQLFGETSPITKLASTYKHIYLHEDDTPSALFPHVKACLASLKQRGYTLAVATGKSRVGLNRLMAETGLENYFSATRTACECASKPSPEMILEICDELAIAPNHAVMIGDTDIDMTMANNAKVTSIGVTFGAHTLAQLEACQPDHIVTQFEQIADLF